MPTPGKIGAGEFALRSAGNVACIAVLVSVGTIARVVEWVGFQLVGLIAAATGCSIDQDAMTPHSERGQPWCTGGMRATYVAGTGVGEGPDQVVEEDATMSSSLGAMPQNANAYTTGPSSSAKGSAVDEHRAALMAKTRAIITTEFGCLDPSLLSQDFQFIFPVVGPLHKAEFVEAFGRFKVREAFPTALANYYGFCVDPLEPNRVWFMSRGYFKHTGALNFGPSPLAPSGKEVHTPPQVLSVSFDDAGLCYKMTGGYVVDRTAGDQDCGGLGGMFGVVTALGLSLPFREGRPWQRSPAWEAFALRVPQLLKDWKRLQVKK